MGRVEGKVAFITGAARGQGRAHATLLAAEGADVIAVDICAAVPSVSYPMASARELAETVRGVEAHGRRAIAAVADVRDRSQLSAALEEGVGELGRLDIVVANAGIVRYAPAHKITEAEWRDMIDINLTGVWHTCVAAMPYLIESGGGSIIITSSAAAIKEPLNLAHYTASKHGVVGLARTLAKELAPHDIRVNTIHPTQVDTPMIMHDETYRLFRPDLESPAREDIVDLSTDMNLLAVPWVDPMDVARSVLFLASDEARYITGMKLTIDAGVTIK